MTIGNRNQTKVLGLRKKSVYLFRKFSDLMKTYGFGNPFVGEGHFLWVSSSNEVDFHGLQDVILGLFPENAVDFFERRNIDA